jgi:hypothetical protein
MPSSARYSLDTAAGRLEIRHFKGPWRVWLDDTFLGSFPTEQAAADALADGHVPLPKRVKVPRDLEKWTFDTLG